MSITPTEQLENDKNEEKLQSSEPPSVSAKTELAIASEKAVTKPSASASEDELQSTILESPATEKAVTKPSASASEDELQSTILESPATENLNLNISMKVPIESFVDVDSHGHPLKTMPNADIMLRAYGIVSRYNVIKKDIEIIIPNEEYCPDTAANSALTLLVSLATLNGIYSGNFERYIYALASNNQFNPIMQFIESSKWDGSDRITDLVNTLTTNEDFKHIKRILVTKWLLSCVAAACLPKGFSSRGVLVLQGAQGLGKTRWVASLIDNPELRDEVIKLDHHLDANNKDTILNAIRHWVVEIGELDSTFKKDVGRLKGFITNDRDKVRLPYDRRESDYPRRTVFAATVNADEYLVDPTGNTRWWTLPCTEIKYDHNINMQQLWAQVYHILQDGGEEAQWWLSSEEQGYLEMLNESHQVSNAIADNISTQLNFDAPKELWKRLSATEVLAQIGITAATNAQARESGSYLRQKFGAPKRSQGKSRWLVPPIIDKQAQKFINDYEKKKRSW